MSSLAARKRAADRRRGGTHVQLASGRGDVHAASTVAQGAYPACRPATSLTTSTRYAHTAAEITCTRCAPDLGDQIDPEPTPAATPQPTQKRRTPRARRASGEGTRARNGKAHDAAQAQAEKIIAEAVAAVKASGEEPRFAPGRQTPVGTPESAVWEAERSPQCSDEDYALAVKVRKLRVIGEAWWRIGHMLELPGSGPSVKQGKTGAANARRAWERAWGKTYSDTTVPRETKETKKERALTQPGKPYFASDAPDVEIIDAVRGKGIHWTTRLAAGDSVVVSLQTADVHTAGLAVVQGRKGRVLNFHEVIEDERGTRMVGPLRSVYINQIEKVGL